MKQLTHVNLTNESLTHDELDHEADTKQQILDEALLTHVTGGAKQVRCGIDVCRIDVCSVDACTIEIEKN